MIRELTKGIALALCLTMPAKAEVVFQPMPTQFIAALGDPRSTSGTDAATWGLWDVDPGPRGVRLRNFSELKANAGRAPAGWQFDQAAWWIEENGLLMEAPRFPLPAGKYVVTGGRETTAVLTVSAPKADGSQDWALSDAANIYDVTHLKCRAAVYVAKDNQACSPEKVSTQRFPLDIGAVMPSVEGCSKLDYQVLIVIGMMIER